MRIAVLGTGMVGRALAVGLQHLGNDVVIGTREPESTLLREGTNGFGTWAAAHPEVVVATFAEAAAGSDLVVNALSGEATLVGLRAAAPAAGTILLDVSNPLASGGGFPPDLFVVNTDSLAEQVQREFPDLHVVKSLHTMTAHLMVKPDGLAGGDFSTFVCGDDRCQGCGHRSADRTRSPRRRRPRRPCRRPRNRGDDADLATADAGAGHSRLHLQDRPLTPQPLLR